MAAFDKDNQPLDREGLAQHIERALAIQPPSGFAHEANDRIIRQLFKPTLLHADTIPQQPCLFVGNHSLFALDGLVLTSTMLHQLGRFLRPMGDKAPGFRICSSAVLPPHPVCAARIPDSRHPRVCAHRPRPRACRPAAQ